MKQGYTKEVSGAVDSPIRYKAEINLFSFEKDGMLAHFPYPNVREHPYFCCVKLFLGRDEGLDRHKSEYPLLQVDAAYNPAAHEFHTQGISPWFSSGARYPHATWAGDLAFGFGARLKAGEIRALADEMQEMKELLGYVDNALAAVKPLCEEILRSAKKADAA